MKRTRGKNSISSLSLQRSTEFDHFGASTSMNSMGSNKRAKRRGKAGLTSTSSLLRANSDNDSFPTQPDVRKADRHNSGTGGSAVRVVTAFRGGVIPEHKGHMPRVGHTAVLYQRDFYIFGGINAKGQYSSHLYKHEKRSLQWEEVRGVGIVPPGRANHTAVLSKTKILIYGGHRNLEVFDDLFSYDLAASRWDKIGYEKSQGPGPVFLHSATIVPTLHCMIIMGGFHQRQHNRYIGHSFDIRNRVWTGIPGPAAVNPQHLQLVTTTFYEPSSSLIVIGLVELDTVVMPPPSVYTMNVHSSVWKKIDTSASPESPIPFRLDLVWNVFMRDFIAMDGFYEELQRSWYFPISLELIEEALISRQGSRPTVSQPGKIQRPDYGFFKLQVDEMSWSIVPTGFPRKMLSEIAVRHRERVQKPSAVNAWRQNLASIQAQHQRLQQAQAQQQLMEEVGLHTMSNTGAGGATTAATVAAAATHHGNVIQHMASRRSSMSVESAATVATLPQGIASAGVGSVVGGGSTSGTSIVANPIPPMPLSSELPGQSSTPYAFSVQGEPQFFRKYVYAAFRDPTTGTKPKPMQYLIMHGGLAPGENYAMLMFTPVYSRVDAFSAGKIYESATDVEDGNPMRWDENMDDDLHAHSVVSGMSMSAQRGPLSGSGELDGSSSMNEDMEALARSACLLPMLPCMRSQYNAKRFAVLFHPNNSTRNERMVPHPHMPIAILEHEKDVHHWSHQYYSDSRRWLAEKLKDAVADDRQLRRSRRRLQGGGAGGSAGSGAGAGDGASGGAMGSSVGGLDSSDDEDLDLSTTGDVTATAAGAKRKGGADATQAIVEEAFGTSSTKAAAKAKGEKRKEYKRDFFESRGLDVFNVTELTEAVDTAKAAAAADQEDSRMDDVSRSALSETVPPGLERLWMRVKRHSEQQRLPSSIFQSSSSGAPHVADLGSAMAYVILHNAISALDGDASPESNVRRAKYRWRYLRSLVRTGEAAFILYRISQEESKMKGQPITSSPGLVLAPELHLVGPTRPYKIPARPIPYTVPHPPKQAARFAEVCPSGMVVYHGMKHVK